MGGWGSLVQIQSPRFGYRPTNLLGPAVTVALVIPAYNAETTLPALLSSLKQLFDNRHILVVDDGSTDSTVPRCHESKILVVSHVTNLGKGAALRTGFAWAMEQGYDAVITMDADGQHDWQLVTEFTTTATLETVDLLIGSRMEAPHEMPVRRQISNKLTSWLISRRIGQRIPDSQSGYRLIRANVLKAITLETNRFQTESELIIKAGLMGFRIGSSGIPSIYRNSKSSIRPVRDTWRFILLYLRSFFWTYGA